MLRLSAAIKVVPVAKAAARFYTWAKNWNKIYHASCSLGLITNANRGFRLTCARTRLLQCGDQKTSCSDFVLINVKWGLKKDTHTWHAGWNPFSLSPFLLLFGLSAAIKPVKASNRGDFWMVVNSATSNWIMSEYEREAEKRVQMATFISFSFCPGISLALCA